MKKMAYSGWMIIWAFLAMLLLVQTGCSRSAPSRFYTLQPVRPAPVGGAALDGMTGAPVPNIGIVFVEIPDYLDRPEVVTRTGPNSLHIADYDRWGGDLRSDITRVLAEVLSSHFPERRAAVATGRRALMADYKVTVNVTRLDPVPGESVWLKASWFIAGKSGRTLVSRESDLNEPLRGRDAQSAVTAMSVAVDRLGNEIAGALKPVIAGPAVQKQTAAPDN